MKHVISESKLHNVIDKIFKKHFKDNLVMLDKDGDGYLLFIPEKFMNEYSKMDDEMKLKNNLFRMSDIHRNKWGNLFFDDIELLEKLNMILSFRLKELGDILLEYFRSKYDTYFKKITFPDPDDFSDV